MNQPKSAPPKKLMLAPGRTASLGTSRTIGTPMLRPHVKPTSSDFFPPGSSRGGGVSETISSGGIISVVDTASCAETMEADPQRANAKNVQPSLFMTASEERPDFIARPAVVQHFGPP